MASGHVYEWAKARGYWVRAGDDTKPTHLLLDGGRLRVPDESHGAFLNAYAISLARHPSRPPCVVELRTPVFKMFLDIDCRFDTCADAEAALNGNAPWFAAFRAIAEAVQPGARALVCVANRVKPDGDAFKLGFHVVFPSVFVTSPTALRVREFVVERLVAAGVHPPGMHVAWNKAIDPSVLRSNGLRMAWSAKGVADSRIYVLRFLVGGDGQVERVCPSSVSAVRDALHELSIRAPTAVPTPGFGGGEEDGREEAATGEARGCTKSLAAYADVLPDVDGALPVLFAGQRFTGVVVSEHCAMLRSTSRFCLNLGRAHRTNNVYFMLTRRGVCQRCYCRCETTDGRKYGMCKDFSSDYWPVPSRVTDAFFGESETPAPQGASSARPSPATAVAPMPSRVAKDYLGLDRLMARARPELPAAKRRRRA